MDAPHSKRRRLRIPLPVEILREADGQPRFLGYLENVSETGIFIQCASPRRVGTCMKVRLRLPGSASPFEGIDVEVLWIRGYKGRNGPTPGMGLRFMDLGSELIERIQAYCAEVVPKERPVVEGAGAGMSSNEPVPQT